jgi:hypothetical protein
VTFDGVAPSVTINQLQARRTRATAPRFSSPLTFSEAVTGFTAGDVTLGGTAGPTTAIVSGGPTIYQVSVSGMTSDGTVTASIAAGVAADAAGNPNTASTSTDNVVGYDGTVPTVTVDQAPAQVDPTSVSPILFRAVFSEPVSGFSAAGVVVGGTAGGRPA